MSAINIGGVKFRGLRSKGFAVTICEGLVRKAIDLLTLLYSLSSLSIFIYLYMAIDPL